MTPEIITLTVFCAALALYASWSLGRQRMASSIAVVKQQNADLLSRIGQLERDRDHDRLLIDSLRTDNDAMRLEQAKLKEQVASLENSLRLSNQEKNYWQQRADEGRR